MAVALLHLCRAALGPDQFAHPAHRATVVLVGEIPPERDHGGRIAADLLDADEAQHADIAAELVLEQIRLLLPHRYEGGLARLHGTAQKRGGPCHVLVGALVDQRLMLKTGVFHGLLAR
jgi:hypothetical protein